MSRSVQAAKRAAKGFTKTHAIKNQIESVLKALSSYDIKTPNEIGVLHDIRQAWTAILESDEPYSVGHMLAIFDEYYQAWKQGRVLDFGEEYQTAGDELSAAFSLVGNHLRDLDTRDNLIRRTVHTIWRESGFSRLDFPLWQLADECHLEGIRLSKDDVIRLFGNSTEGKEWR